MCLGCQKHEIQLAGRGGVKIAETKETNEKLKSMKVVGNHPSS